MIIYIFLEKHSVHPDFQKFGPGVVTGSISVIKKKSLCQWLYPSFHYSVMYLFSFFFSLNRFARGLFILLVFSENHLLDLPLKATV